jgi:hypothetical protein
MTIQRGLFGDLRLHVNEPIVLQRNDGIIDISKNKISRDLLLTGFDGSFSERWLTKMKRTIFFLAMRLFFGSMYDTHYDHSFKTQQRQCWF